MKDPFCLSDGILRFLVANKSIIYAFDISRKPLITPVLSSLAAYLNILKQY